MVSEVDAMVRDNFGHAGVTLIQYILDNRAQWGAWRKRYRAELKKFEDRARTINNPFAGRMATHFAAISTTAWIADQALDFPWDYRDPVEPLWHQLVQEAGEANQAAAALRHVVEWAYAHQDEFFGRQVNETRAPNHGWAGRWDKGPSHPEQADDIATWKWIGFFRGKLESLLEEKNYEPDAIIRTWKDDGLLVVDQSKGDRSRSTKKARVGGETSTCRLIAIRRSAIEQVTSG